MIRRFCCYIEKVFDFSERLSKLKDGRKKARIPCQKIWLQTFFMFVMRMRSLNAMEPQLRFPTYAENLLGETRVSADRIGDVYALMDPEPIRDLLAEINHQIKRNKALKTIRLRVTAVDGHELFSSRSRYCDGCLSRTLEINGQKVTEYYHRIVACHLIGFPLALPLDIESVLPGEGEVKAAKRLLVRVLKRYPRFFDVVEGDAIYLEGPFFNFCLEKGKDAIAVLKENTPGLLADAKGLFNAMAPTHAEEDPKKSFKMWDVEGFNSLETVSVPLRVLYSQEQETKRKRVKKKWTKQQQEHHRWWATTLSQNQLPTQQLRKAGCGRWEIENNLFHQLSTHWSMNHCFKHDPNAILCFLLTLMVAFVLIQSFFVLNIKTPARKRWTLIALATQLLVSLAQTDFKAPWLEPDPVSQPP